MQQLIVIIIGLVVFGYVVYHTYKTVFKKNSRELHIQKAIPGAK